jgi:hypothetical protein
MKLLRGQTAYDTLKLLSKENHMDDQQMYQAASRGAGAKLGFYIHLVIYVLLNIILATVNLVFSPHVLWFPFPLLGWGIGLLAHGLAVFLTRPSTLKKKMIEREMNRMRDSDTLRPE